MAIAPIENGKIVETASQTSIKESEKKKNNSTVDKDQFLQLLVAQMNIRICWNQPPIRNIFPSTRPSRNWSRCRT